jgi:hypothetical protein
VISRALAQFVEQARVLDGDDGLISKRPHQGDLLVCEGPHLSTPNRDSPRKIRVVQKRDGQDGASPIVLENYGREARLDGDVCNVHGPALQGRQPRWPISSRLEPQTHEPRSKFRRPITGCLSHENTLVISTEQREIAVAQARCVGEDSIEHRSQVCGRSAEDIEDLCHCRLLLQRLGNGFPRFG